MNDATAFGGTTDESATSGHAKKATSLRPVGAGFDIKSVRCAVEARLDASIRKDEDFFGRIRDFSKECEPGRVQHQLALMTEGYRVDEAITPKLARLGTVLTRALRLAQPVDIFVMPSHECNAYCLPSRKGNRLIMCLYSGVIEMMSSQELLFVMGHEVGHALFRHAEIPPIGFDHAHFSPLEVVRARALGRAKEITCDRIGLLACQDTRVASAALFKVASGLTERWISFDESAYSRHFDDLSAMSELIDLEDAARTHPLTPLRVKALITFANSEAYARAFGRGEWSVSTDELERRVETMLSVLDPDVSELEGKDEKDAANRFLFDGALLVIGADGVVEPQEVAWLERQTSDKWSGEALAKSLSSDEFRHGLRQRLETNAAVLRNKLSDMARAGLLHTMFDVALSAGGIPESEGDALHQLRELLGISGELAGAVYRAAKSEASDESDISSDGPSQHEATSQSAAPVDPLEAILQQANLPAKAQAAAQAACSEIRSQTAPLGIYARKLLAWSISASRDGGPLTEAQGKKLAVATIRVCREIHDRRSMPRKARSAPMDKLVKQHGVVALFSRNENVYLGSADRPYVILSVSRAKSSVVIAPLDNLEETTEVDPRELRKDLVQGAWPAEIDIP
jgi:uncharacterized tellurite resistance protein B-like protein